MLDYCLICGNPDNNGNRYCKICLKEISIYNYNRHCNVEERIRQKNQWIDVDPPPHKDDF